MSTQPDQRQMLTALVTTTIFEALGLFAGAVLLAISAQADLSFLGVIGLGVWFIALWAENYSVAGLVVPRFGLDKTASILAMSAAEFVTWALWAILVVEFDLHWLPALVILALLVQLHHAVQFAFFYKEATIQQGLQNPVLFAASVVEAIAGQWLIVAIINTSVPDLTFSGLIGPLVGLLVLFTVEHVLGGKVKPAVGG